MAIRRKKIRALAEKLLSDHQVVSAPVPAMKIARRSGAKIVLKSLEGDLCGFLYQAGDEKIIGVNTQHSQARQLFTLCHELGHLLLHDQEPLHYDRGFKLRLRSSSSAEGTEEAEIEANLFAAELLMPALFIEEDLDGTDEIDLEEDDFIEELAEKYEVSKQAMMYRLNYLGYIELS
jgi:Zn-dependent peptidase ImmA (M78 family)